MASSTTLNTTCSPMDKLHRLCRCRIDRDRDRLVASKASASTDRARVLAKSATWSRFKEWICRCMVNKCKWWGRGNPWACPKVRSRCQINRWCSLVCRASETTVSKWEAICTKIHHHKDLDQATLASAHNNKRSSKITDTRFDFKKVLTQFWTKT